MADDVLKATSSSFLKRPEGKLGLAIPLVLGAAAIYFFGSAIGDFVVNAVDNMFHLAVVIGALCLGGWVLLDPKFRTLAFYLYRSLMRMITGMFIDIDPIGVLKTYKDRMQEKLNEMSTSLSALKGQRLKVERLLAQNTKDLEEQFGILNQAAKTGNERAKALAAKQIDRLNTMKTRYTEDLNRMILLITVLNRYYELCTDTITDMDREIQFRQQEREYSKSSRSVVRNATAILKGLPEKEMWDQGMEALERQYTEAIGEVENFLDVTKNILTTADLQDGASADKAMALLDQWQKKNSGVALGSKDSCETKASVLQNAVKQIAGAPESISTGKPQYAPATVSASSGDDYLRMASQYSGLSPEIFSDVSGYLHDQTDMLKMNRQ